ncbi:Cation-independent mannose-6-phosphate receptor CI-MPR [Savitreella phatthalungensis]
MRLRSLLITNLVLLGCAQALVPSTLPPAQRNSDRDGDGVPDEELEPCTARHPVTKEFYDLRGLIRSPDETKALDWHANGHDYGSNFTLNVCAPLIDLSSQLPKAVNTSAMYFDEEEKAFSIGQTSTTPKFRGKKLILEYLDGSACPGKTSYRKSSLIMFTCDASMIGTASVSFIGSLEDCAYFFEYRTSRACATTKDIESAISPGYVFLIILLVALGVYFVGGCMYSRAVLNQRGWKQVPHHETIRSVIGFVVDFALIIGVTIWDKVQPLLARLGLARRKDLYNYSSADASGANPSLYSHGQGGAGSQIYGAYRDRDLNTTTTAHGAAHDLEADPDNQLIDDLENDRW